MPKYSKTSLKRLRECHEDLQIVFMEVIKYFDCTIICGRRGRIFQNKAFVRGFSKLKYPFSKHNKLPKSEATDSVPYPIQWYNINRMRFFAGFVLGIAAVLYAQGKIKHRIRCGIDWDMDTELRDQRFNDLPHYEIVK